MDRSNNPRLAFFGTALAALVFFGFDGGSCGGTAGDAPTGGAQQPVLDPACEELPCDVYCEYGHVPDANGCPTCECNPAPSCVPVACELYCENGFARGPDGCEVCACSPPPQANRCAGLDERTCNATPGCLGVYGDETDPGCGCPECDPADPNCPPCDCDEGSESDADDEACVCSPCPEGATCVCDCPARQVEGPFRQCVMDGAAGPGREPASEPPPSRPGVPCDADEDCGPHGTCEEFASCAAIGCPEPGSYCVYADEGSR